MLIPRSAWTATIPKSNVGAEEVIGTPYFRPSEVTGISFFTPNESSTFTDISPYTFLEGYRKTDNSLRGFGDISYNFAVAPNVKGAFCLRGLCNKSAAHKSKENNSSNVAVLVLLGNEEPPTDTLMENLITCRNFILSKYPNATKVLSTLPFSNFWHLPEAYGQEASVQVFELIENLSYWGYYRARNDGVYGPVTRNAVLELQADLAEGSYYMKRVDGFYGRYTREAFCAYLKS
jgi:hypothetical protein